MTNLAPRRLATLLVLLLLSPTAFSRVISYAPYTDKVALRGYQSRTTRHFVLLEAAAQDVSGDSVNRGQAVLYDSSGREEPRVIYPLSGPQIPLRFVALHQERDDVQPMILLGTYETVGNLPYAAPVTRLSTDGGRTWQRIAELDNKEVRVDTDFDTGGPWTRGLAVPVRIGTSVPFIVSYYGGVWAIRANGTAVALTTSDPASIGVTNTLVAQNREGTRFVVRSADSLSLLDLNGNLVSLGPVDVHANYSGWITPEGAVYLIRHRADGRFLYIHRNGQWQLVAGPDGIAEPNGPPMTWRQTMSFFAIPTADFRGAWIIQRDTGKPTILSRHEPGEDLERMWTDISGPQVEALHAGSSNERLMIQVHRERPAQEIPFVDPALAVWKVGEPAPRSYDELYLNEGITKGFVHLDVETVADGTPFVFDSGFTQQVPDIIVSPPVGGGGDVIQEWGVVRASLRQRLVLPGVARLPGAFNSYWLTDVVLYNPLDEKQTVAVQFVSLGEEVQIAAANVVTLTLEPMEIRVVPDALKALFNIDNGGGALYFTPAQAINVTGRTYSRTAAGGSFGFGMQAIDFFNAAGPRFPLSFAGAFPGSNFRTNVILTDASGRGTAARLQAYGVSGTMGASDVQVAAPINGIMQTNGVAAMLGLGTHESGGLVVQATHGATIPAVVAIDNRTNDPTYFPPDLPASTIRTIPVIGHLDGAHGSRFRSDIYLLNLSNTTRSVTLEVKQWDTRDPVRQLNFTLLPHEARVIEDALMKLFNMTGVARLRYWSDGGAGDTSGVRVTSRTYNIDANGGTHGSLIPPLNNFQSATGGEALEIIGVVGGSGFRTNVGLVELSAFPNARVTNVRLRIFDDKGRNIDTFTVELPSAGGMQINDIFAARGLTAPTAARIVVQVLDATGLVGAYATLTDNITNDTTYLGAQLAANPN